MVRHDAHGPVQSRSSALKRVELTNNRIILGTVQFGMNYGIGNTSGQPPEHEVFRILQEAKASGIETLDTAAAYGSAEEIIGEWHREHSAFLVNTKLILAADGNLEKACDDAILRLRVPRIHTLFLHRYSDLESMPWLVTDLQRLKNENKIARTGISVYTNEEAEHVLRIPEIDVVQLPYNLLDNVLKRGEIIRKLREAGKEVQVRSVFLQGLFFLPEHEIPAVLQPLVPDLRKIRQLANDNEIPLQALAMQYAFRNEHINHVLMGVDHLQHLLNNLNMLKLQIPDRVFEAVDTINVQDTRLLNPVHWK